MREQFPRSQRWYFCEGCDAQSCNMGIQEREVFWELIIICRWITIADVVKSFDDSINLGLGIAPRILWNHCAIEDNSLCILIVWSTHEVMQFCLTQVFEGTTSFEYFDVDYFLVGVVFYSAADMLTGFVKLMRYHLCVAHSTSQWGGAAIGMGIQKTFEASSTTTRR